jgi:hypothetical protein
MTEMLSLRERVIQSGVLLGDDKDVDRASSAQIERGWGSVAVCLMEIPQRIILPAAFSLPGSDRIPGTAPLMDGPEYRQTVHAESACTEDLDPNFALRCHDPECSFPAAELRAAQRTGIQNNLIRVPSDGLAYRHTSQAPEKNGHQDPEAKQG